MPSRLPLILASQSPRRAELLRQIGVPFEVVVANVHELSDEGKLSPLELVCANARLKASSAPCAPDRILVAADTIVVLDDEILGKPADAQQATAMLRRLSGRTHAVITGMFVGPQATGIVATVETRVAFAALDDALIRRYVACGEPLDKAGAYGIQGRGAALIERMEGDYFNVVGLSIARLAQMLRGFGVEVAEHW